jgi:hypothetical protein
MFIITYLPVRTSFPQDKLDDAAIGLKSTALLFGDRSREILSGFAVLSASCLALSGYMAELSAPFYLGVAGGLGHMLWQVASVATFCVRLSSCAPDASVVVGKPTLFCWRAHIGGVAVAVDVAVAVAVGECFGACPSNLFSYRLTVRPLLT